MKTSIKLYFESRVHRLVNLPDTFETFKRRIFDILKTDFPGKLILEYRDLDGEQIILQDQDDYFAMLECTVKISTTTTKVYVISSTTNLPEPLIKPLKGDLDDARLNVTLVSGFCVIPYTDDEKLSYKTVLLKNSGTQDWPSTLRLECLATSAAVNLTSLSCGEIISCILPKHRDCEKNTWSLTYSDANGTTFIIGKALNI